MNGKLKNFFDNLKVTMKVTLSGGFMLGVKSPNPMVVRLMKTKYNASVNGQPKKRLIIHSI